MAAFLNAWREIIGDKPISTAELITILDTDAALSVCLPMARNKETDFARALGRALGKKQDVRYPNGLMLRKAGKQHKVLLWQVVEFKQM